MTGCHTVGALAAHTERFLLGLKLGSHAIGICCAARMGSPTWPILLILGRSPLSAMCHPLHHLYHGPHRPDSILLPGTPLAYPMQHSASWNAVDQHASAVLHVLNAFLSFTDHSLGFSSINLVICDRRWVICYHWLGMSPPSTMLRTVDVFLFAPAKAQRAFCIFWSTRNSSLPYCLCNN